jgi:phosphate acetyltransferase
VKIVDPVTSELRKDFGQTYFELRKHKGVSRQMALDAMTDMSTFGTMMVYRGIADGMVSGVVHTTQHTIRPALEFIRTSPGCSIVSSVFFMCLPDRVQVYGDWAISPDPNGGSLRTSLSVPLQPPKASASNLALRCCRIRRENPAREPTSTR